jgi:hypothetical protein
MQFVCYPYPLGYASGIIFQHNIFQHKLSSVAIVDTYHSGVSCQLRVHSAHPTTYTPMNGGGQIPPTFFISMNCLCIICQGSVAFFHAQSIYYGVWYGSSQDIGDPMNLVAPRRGPSLWCKGSSAFDLTMAQIYGFRGPMPPSNLLSPTPT